MGIVSYIYVIQDDGILDVAVISNKRFFKNNRIFHRAVNNTAAGNQAVGYLDDYIIFGMRQVINIVINIRILP